MIRMLLGAIILAAGVTAQAGMVTYEVGEYKTSGYSASWLHAATGCNSGDLWMCGALDKLGGTFSGDLVDGTLSGITGTLTAGSHIISITDGRIGGSFESNWFLETSLGTFLFENLAMGTGKPNIFDGNSMILWGQNKAAYEQGQGPVDGAWGIDIYATQVPEPGSIALIALGLAGLVLTRRTRRV